MKQYFIRLFDFDLSANLAIIDTILSSRLDGKPVLFMAHVLAAQQSWLERCRLESPSGIALWPEWPATELKAIALQNNREWLTFLNSLTDDDIYRSFSYKNTQGQPFRNTFEEVLAHLINHGTHHRAQAGQYLKQAGAQLPNTDYIFYIRQRQ